MRTTGTFRCTHPIGVDVGSHCVKMTQVRPGRSGSTVVATCAPVPGDGDRSAALLEAMQTALRAGNFSGRRAVIAAPHDLIEYRNMRVPRLAGAALTATVQENLARHLNLPANAYTSQYFDAGEVWEHDEARREIIAMAVPHDRLFDLLATIESAGLVPLAVDAVPSAARRGLATTARTDAAAAARVLLDVGYGSTTIVITCDERIRFVRRLDIGLRTLDDDAASALSLGRAEAASARDALAGRADEAWPLADTAREAAGLVVRAAAGRVAKSLAAEIQKSLQYHGVTFRSSRPGEGTVIGGGSGEPWLLESLAKETGVALRPIDSPPWTIAAESSAADAAPGLMAIAVGLARYGERPARCAA